MEQVGGGAFPWGEDQERHVFTGSGPGVTSFHGVRARWDEFLRGPDQVVTRRDKFSRAPDQERQVLMGSGPGWAFQVVGGGF